MRNFINIRLCCFAAFLGVCVGASGQIVVYSNPAVLHADSIESFSEFAPAGGTAVSQTDLSIFGGTGTLMLTDPTTSQYSIYNTTTQKWGLGTIGYAGVYGGTQGLGFESTDSSGAPAGVSAALMLTADDTYFGGYFQAVQEPGNSATGIIDFTFFNSSNTQVGTVEQLITSGSTTGSLIGIGFDFTGGLNYSSVEITGVGVAMDSLRIAKTFAVTPEPASFAPLGLGVLFFIRRKRR